MVMLTMRRALRRSVAHKGMRIAPNGQLRTAHRALSAATARKSEPISTNMKLILGYVTFGLAAMATIARAKQRSDDVEESARVYNMAKRAVVKDRRLFESIGYPKDFIRIEAPENENEAESSTVSVFEGSFRVNGDKASAIVVYKHRPPPESKDEKSSSDNVPMFDQLWVTLEDGSEFSAIESYVQTEDVERQQKATGLAKKLFTPVMMGVVIGGISSFLVIRIVRNRPFYVHKLALDRVNNNDVARKYLGHPITSDRKAYIGSLSDDIANYSVACKGPTGEGTLMVKAYKKEPEGEDASSNILATPGTDWKFSTLVLSIKRNELRKEKEKTAKVVDLLPNGKDSTAA